MTSPRKKTKPGPEPESLKAEGTDWESAMEHALNKPKPPEGWPESEKPKRKRGTGHTKRPKDE